MAQTLLFLAIILCLSSCKALRCRCLHGDPECWPNDQEWRLFNTSIEGQLIEIKPPAWPCHDPNYDASLCKIARQNWSSHPWRYSQPGAMMADNWEMDDTRNESCSISDPRSSPCQQGSVPVYGVNVSQISQVKTAVAFARKHNLWLVVKNTGHDYIGRSTARGSISIWMHNLQSIHFHRDIECEEGQEEYDGVFVTIQAGVTWNKLYEAVRRHKREIVGGSCPSVGAAGGYVQGGGHSLLSPTFGFGADNVVELKVVTADGRLKVANKCQNQDLFWALRGGGGGTFGVVVSLTYKTYPAFQNVIFASVNMTAKDRPSFQRAVEEFAGMNPAFSSQGWSGFFSIQNLTLSLRYVLPNKTLAVARSSLDPLMKLQIRGLVRMESSLRSFSSFYELLQKALCGSDPDCKNVGGPAGNPVLQASRLIPINLLKSSPGRISDAFMKISLEMQVPIVGCFVAGGQVSQPNQDSAVNPAWRNSLWLVIVSLSAPKSQRKESAMLVTKANRVMIDMTPGSGSYSNEADYNEPNFQQSFFGSYYSRLYRIKHEVDPSGLFVCHHCVGSEDWSPDLRCTLR